MQCLKKLLCFKTASIPGCTCQFSHLEFFVVFFETCINRSYLIKETPTHTTLVPQLNPTHFKILLKRELVEKSKRTFLSSETFPYVFSKILFCSNQASHDISICIEFHNCRQSSLRREELRRSHRSGHIRALLAPLNNLIFPCIYIHWRYKKF